MFEINRKHVIAMLDEIAGRGSGIMANRTRALTSKIFNFGIQRGVVEYNPVHNVPIPGEERRRDRVLNEDDIRSVDDLRRTAASHMTGIGISRLVVGKILNHAERDVTAVYDRHSYDADKRDALLRWDQRLQEILREPRRAAKRSGPQSRNSAPDHSLVHVSI